MFADVWTRCCDLLKSEAFATHEHTTIASRYLRSASLPGTFTAMRRAQTVRHYGRPSLALGADDLGMLKESPEESTEDVLRRQLIEKDRENDKVGFLFNLTV